MSDLTIRIGVDTSQAVGSVQELSGSVSELNKNLSGLSEARDWKPIASNARASFDTASNERNIAQEMYHELRGNHPPPLPQGSPPPPPLPEGAPPESQRQERIKEVNQRIDSYNDQLGEAAKNGDVGSIIALNQAHNDALAELKRLQSGNAQGGAPPGSESDTFFVNMERVLSDGIAKGFSQGTKEIVANLAKLQGLNPDRPPGMGGSSPNPPRNDDEGHDNPMPKQGRNDPMLSGTGAWVAQQAIDRIAHGIMSSIDTTLSVGKMRASGDYAGADVAEKRGRGELVGQSIGMLGGAGLGAVLSPILGPEAIGIVSSLGSEVGKFIGGIDARKIEEDLAYSQQYKNALPGIDTLNQLFGGDINRKSEDENNQTGLELRDKAIEAARGTGLSTDEMIQALAKTSSYGIRNVDQAMNMTHNQAMWSRFTGTDLATIQKFSGQAYRFGRDADATATAYGGLMAQNMGKGQFGEFLTAMERIMEEGIEKGFVKGTGEIAGNLAMLYKLSGESPLWQGEQGAKRLSQMNSAISNATNLESTEDVITYSVAKDLLGNGEQERKANFKKYVGDENLYTGTYFDNLVLMDRMGASGPMLKGQWNAIQTYEGGNIAGEIGKLKNMFNVNDYGAVQLWNMFSKAKPEDFDQASFQKQVKALTDRPENKSDSARLQDALNNLSGNLVKIGQVKFDETEWNVLNTEADNVKSILAHLQKENEQSNNVIGTGKLLEAILREKDYSRGPHKTGIQYQIEGGLNSINTYKNRNRDDRGEEVAGKFKSWVGTTDPNTYDDFTKAIIRHFASSFVKDSIGVGPLGGINNDEANKYAILQDRLEGKHITDDYGQAFQRHYQSQIDENFGKDVDLSKLDFSSIQDKYIFYLQDNKITSQEYDNLAKALNELIQTMKSMDGKVTTINVMDP